MALEDKKQDLSDELILFEYNIPFRFVLLCEIKHQIILFLFFQLPQKLMLFNCLTNIRIYQCVS